MRDDEPTGKARTAGGKGARSDAIGKARKPKRCLSGPTRAERKRRIAERGDVLPQLQPEGS